MMPLVCLWLFSGSVVSGSMWPHGLQYARLPCLSFTISRSLLKLMSIDLVMPSNHLILCYPFHLLPSIFPSIRVFSSDSALHIRWPKYWSFMINRFIKRTSRFLELPQGLYIQFQAWHKFYINDIKQLRVYQQIENRHLENSQKHHLKCSSVF